MYEITRKVREIVQFLTVIVRASCEKRVLYVAFA